VILAALWFSFAIAAAPNEGAYLVRIAGCADCHSPATDQPFAGGLRLDTEFGFFYAPNITPDHATGIGSWSFDDFRRALRRGVSPDGSYFYPVFPYRSYAKIRDDDMRAMWDYLQSLPPVHLENRPHQLSFPYSKRWLLSVWQDIFFGSYSSDPETQIRVGNGAFVDDPAHTSSWNRGAYLVEAFAHCTECHTPRNQLGGLQISNWMAGSDTPISGRVAVNITPDWLTGKGSWKAEDWMRFLSAGIDPQGLSPGGEMALVIQNTSALSEFDRAAMIEYLMSLPPVRRGTNAPP
jgi:mono/diheme cytochrome c family protein